jgi:hypothetical protein
MKKIATLAATALASTLAFATPAAAQSIEVGRQTLLDNGSAPATLRLNLTAQVTANGTHTLTCALNQPVLTTPSAMEDFAALGVQSSIITNSTTPVTVGALTLTYGGRINPKGMAVGDAIYTGSATPVSSSSATASGLSCPQDRQVSVGARDAIPGHPGQPFIAAVPAVDPVYGTKKEEACMILAQADPKDDLIPGKCPDVIDTSVIVTPGQEAVAGQEFIAAVADVPAVPAQSVTISYTPSYSFSQTNISVVVDGQTFTF